MKLRHPVIVLGLAFSLLAVGCGGSDSADAVADAETSAAPDDTPSDGGASEDKDAGPSTTGSERTSDDSAKDASGGDAKPVATLNLETATALNKPVTLRIDVLKLRRSGNSVLLSFQINNLSDDNFMLFDKLAEDKDDSNSVSGVSLVDLDNDKRYLTLVDSEGNCVCTEGNGALPTVSAQGSLTLQASFPAPPKDITTVDVDLGGLGVIGDVPLETV